jgi:hypothetical protein
VQRIREGSLVLASISSPFTLANEVVSPWLTPSLAGRMGQRVILEPEAQAPYGAGMDSRWPPTLLQDGPDPVS